MSQRKARSHYPFAEGIWYVCPNNEKVYPPRLMCIQNLGSRGFGKVIPPNSALVFDVELVGLESTAHDEL